MCLVFYNCTCHRSRVTTNELGSQVIPFSESHFAPIVLCNLNLSASLLPCAFATSFHNRLSSERSGGLAHRTVGVFVLCRQRVIFMQRARSSIEMLHHNSTNAFNPFSQSPLSQPHSFKSSPCRHHRHLQPTASIAEHPNYLYAVTRCSLDS